MEEDTSSRLDIPISIYIGEPLNEWVEHRPQLWQIYSNDQKDFADQSEEGKYTELFEVKGWYGLHSRGGLLLVVL